MNKPHSTQVTNQTRYKELAKKGRIMSNDFESSSSLLRFPKPSASKPNKSPAKTGCSWNMQKSDVMRKDSFQNPFCPSSAKENRNSFPKRPTKALEKSARDGLKLFSNLLLRPEPGKKYSFDNRRRSNVPPTAPRDPSPQPPEPQDVPSPEAGPLCAPQSVGKLDVQMTASFNLYSSDIFKDAQLEISETFAKLEKVFDTGTKWFNKSQTAFALKSVGMVEHLNDEFNGETHEEDLMINIVYSCLKNESGKVRPESLHHFLYLMKVLLKNNVVLLASKQPAPVADKEAKVSSQETVKLRTEKKENRDRGGVVEGRAEGGEQTRERKEFSVGKGKRRTTSCLKDGESKLQFSVEEKDQFSFKKSMDFQRADKPGRHCRIKDFVLPTQSELSEGLTNRNLTREFEEWKEFKTESVRQAQGSGGDANSARVESVKEGSSRLCCSEEAQQLKSSKGSDHESSPGIVELLSEKSRGRFLFSTYIRQGSQSHSLMVYDKDDVQELAKSFCERHKFDLTAAKSIFEKIEWQKANFTKNFVVDFN